MRLAALPAPRAQQEDQRLLHARLAGLPRGLDVLRGRGALGDAPEGLVIPRFRADVEQGQPQLPEPAQGLR